MNAVPVFVYGTLRKGGSNHHRMAGTDYVGEGKISGRMYRIDWYPALVCGGGTAVKGELYHVADSILEALDRFEGITPGAPEPREYRRVKTVVSMENGEPREAWVWEWAGDLGGVLPLNGEDWLDYEPNPTQNDVVERKPIPPDVLLGAYAQGVFPMADDGEIVWVSPQRRGIIPLDERFHIPRGLKKALRKNAFEIRFNTAFREVMSGCADRLETWIDSVILESYCALHELGHAHSVECWDGEGLQGGLYGVSLGKAFFGESMFSRKTDASKIAIVALVEKLRELDFRLLDTQWLTPHLQTFGGFEIPRDEYLGMLKKSL